MSQLKKTFIITESQLKNLDDCATSNNIKNNVAFNVMKHIIKDVKKSTAKNNIKCPMCNGEFEKVVWSDDVIIYLCKKCERHFKLVAAK